MVYEWEARIEKPGGFGDEFRTRTDIYIYRKSPGSIELLHFDKSGIPMTEKLESKEGLYTEIKPTIRFNTGEDFEILHSLFEALKKFFPSDDKDNRELKEKWAFDAGKLSATLSHLEDLRKLVFKNK